MVTRRFSSTTATQPPGFVEGNIGGVALPATSFRNAYHLGDLDGDGDLDIAVTNGSMSFFINDGTGVFSAGQTLAISNTRDGQFGDLDGDGDLDFLVVTTGANEVLLNDGSTTFTSSQSFGSSNSRSIGLSDIDGDGDLDAFIGNTSQADKVWTNNGTGTFSDSGQSLDANSFPYSVTMADIEGDGDFDAVIAKYGGGSQVFLNNGSGTFSNSGLNFAGSAQDAAVGDVNNDGAMDIVIANRPGQNPVFLNQVIETEVTLSGNDLLITDINGGTSNDRLTISADATDVTITDPVNLITTAIAGATGSGTNTVTVPLSAFTGDVKVMSLGGDDEINIDGLNL